jgi:hypothetical protein
MKHKTWFRLVIKAIGVLLLGFSIPEIVQVMSYFLLVDWPSTGTFVSYNWIYGIIAPSLQTAIGAYLLIDGRWIIDKSIPSNRPYCPECGYDLSQSRGEKCPECGVTVPTTNREIPGEAGGRWYRRVAREAASGLGVTSSAPTQVWEPAGECLVWASSDS